jgi:hypothetical protein
VSDEVRSDEPQRRALMMGSRLFFSTPERGTDGEKRNCRPGESVAAIETQEFSWRRHFTTPTRPSSTSSRAKRLRGRLRPLPDTPPTRCVRQACANTSRLSRQYLDKSSEGAGDLPTRTSSSSEEKARKHADVETKARDVRVAAKGRANEAVVTRRSCERVLWSYAKECPTRSSTKDPRLRRSWLKAL